MKTAINTPIFYYPSNFFTGDIASQFYPLKYLWHICNNDKNGFYDPVYNFKLSDKIKIDMAFYPSHPIHLYFKKPKWINKFIAVSGIQEANRIALQYDYFINNYRYRGAHPAEMNWGYSSKLNILELSLVAYTFKAAFDLNIYIDDLELKDEYKEFLKETEANINPNKKPIVVIHHRGKDPWNRHLKDSLKLNESLLFNLLNTYRDHIFILVGESWGYYGDVRIKYLDRYINIKTLMKKFNICSQSLKYILSAFFCKDADLIFVGMSGFTLFIESIRPLNLMPPIPVFWGPKTFTGIDTSIEAQEYWECPEFKEYRLKYPYDEAFHHDCHHFLYYSRNIEILRPYCLDFPNDLKKIYEVLNKLEIKYRNKAISYDNDFSRLKPRTNFKYKIIKSYKFICSLLLSKEDLFYLIKAFFVSLKIFIKNITIISLKNTLRKTVVHRIYKKLKNKR